jgi:hypothetical protein
MTFDPLPLDLVGSAQFQKAFPEIPVYHRFFFGISPLGAHPLIDPLRHSFNHIGGICHHSNAARSLQKTQPLYDCSQLHAIVGCFRIASRDFVRGIAISQNGSIATGAGVPAASAICKEFHNSIFSGIQKSSPFRKVLPMKIGFHGNCTSKEEGVIGSSSMASVKPSVSRGEAVGSF